MQYYPEHRHLLENTNIQREQFLPEDAIGSVEARPGASVNLRDVVAHGRLPSRVVIVEAARFFKLKKSDQLFPLLEVAEGDEVNTDSVLAALRNRRLVSPVAGIVTYIGDGRVIIQTAPQEIELEAGVDGHILRVDQGRGVVIESFGTLIQGVWGNNQDTIGMLKIEPNAGLESLYGEDLDIQYRGSIIVTRRPLRTTGIQVLEDQDLNGIIAPSMEADLIERVLHLPHPVMLTEGFGSLRMNPGASNLLTASDGRQATLDAVLPGRWESRRPQVIVNPSGRGSRAIRPRIDMVLEEGTEVLLARPPHAGAVGKVVNLPKSPQLLENGLRVMCAEVELVTGETVTVPLTNIEVFGR
jgi:hypothetical protein